jgi:V8-like Glu-specific endopeptidase
MFKVPQLKNEDIKDYLKNSDERIEVQNTYNSMYSQNIKIPL